MNTQLFFIYDTHCPWSYAALPLVNKITEAFPQIEVHLFHCARYEGDENVSKKTVKNVEELSNLKFSENYLQNLPQPKDSTLAANFCAWLGHKLPQQALPIVNQMMNAHFEQGVALTAETDLAEIISQFKLSPPSKVFSPNKLTRNAESILHDIHELQDVIETIAIPALLLAIDEKLILLNHNFYLSTPEAIIDAVKIELS